jgi:hypothetical protein
MQVLLSFQTLKALGRTSGRIRHNGEKVKRDGNVIENSEPFFALHEMIETHSKQGGFYDGPLFWRLRLWRNPVQVFSRTRFFVELSLPGLPACER